MDWRKREKMLKPARPSCHHSRASKTNKSLICCLCICENVQDLLYCEAEVHSQGSPNQQPISQSVMNELLHSVRLINTSLDGAEYESNEDLRKIIDTFSTLLKLQNDEIGVMISQIIQKIPSKSAVQLQEYLMEKICTSQPSRKETVSFGVLECLRIVLLKDQGAAVFLKKYCRQIMPQIFQTLRSTAAAFKNRLTVLKEINVSQFSQSQSQTFVEPPSLSLSLSGSREDALKAVVSIFSIMTKLIELSKKEDTLYNELVHCFLPHSSEIITACLLQLKESQPEDLMEKILAFLTGFMSIEVLHEQVLHSHKNEICSTLKKLLLANIPIVQKFVINLLSVILDNIASRHHGTTVPDFLDAINRADLVCGIAQAMATSDPELFSQTVELLSTIHSFNSMRDRVGATIESGLRVAAIVIQSDYSTIANACDFFYTVLRDLKTVPLSIQQQIVAVYGKLPESLESKETLEWAKLLLFCDNSAVYYHLVRFYFGARDLLIKTNNSVSVLKLFLLIAQALLQSVPQAQCVSQRENSESAENNLIKERSVFLDLMSSKCIPAIQILAKCGQSMENEFVKILLKLMLTFPTDRLIPPSRTVRGNVTFFDVSYHESKSLLPTVHKVALATDTLYGPDGYWSAGSLIRILMWVRANLELIKDRYLLDLWNENWAYILVDRLSMYLPSLTRIWGRMSTDVKNDKILFLCQMFDKMDLDVCKWNETFTESPGVTSVQTHAVLVIYYFICLFNLGDPDTLINSKFEKGLAAFLKQISEATPAYPRNLVYTFFKIALLIISCKPSENLDAFEALFETLVYSTLETSKLHEMEEIITFCGNVMEQIISWNIFPMYFSVHLVESWLEKDPGEARRFFTHAELSSEIRNHIIEIAADGSVASSNFMVEVAASRIGSWSTEAEKRSMLVAITRLEKEILVDKASTKLLNFSNLLSLALHELKFFDSSLLDTFPIEIFTDLIQILILNHDVRRVSLKFLSNCLFQLRARTVLNVCLEKEFLKFLNELMNKDINFDLNEDSFAEICHVYEIINLLYQSMESCNQTLDRKFSRLTWTLQSAIASLQLYGLQDPVLGLITYLLRTNFKPRLIQIEELGNTEVLFNTLITIQCLARSIIHKAFSVDSEIGVWNFFRELLEFSQRKHGEFLKKVEWAFDPWNILTFNCYISPTKSLLSLPTEFWKFVLCWTKLVSKQKTYCNVKPYYEAFGIGNFIGNLLARIKSDLSSDECHVLDLEDRSWTPDCVADLFLKRNETEDTLRKLLGICSKLADDSIDWENLMAVSNVENDDEESYKSVSDTSDTTLDKDVGNEVDEKDVGAREVSIIVVSDSSQTCSESELHMFD